MCRFNEHLSDALAKKVNAVANTRGHTVRKISDAEFAEIRALDDWHPDGDVAAGWFTEEGGAQIVAGRRTDRQVVVFSIGH